MKIETLLYSAALFVGCSGPGAVAGAKDGSSRDLNAGGVLAGEFAGHGSAGRDSEKPPAYALAIHGGAGAPSPDLAPKVRAAYGRALRDALALGEEQLAAGSSALDVVEAVVRHLEDEPLFNAGRGAVFTAAGGHELDASIMDGRTLATGAVAAVTTVKNPISLAREVMESTRHVLLVGQGAEAFATEAKAERVSNSYFSTDERRAQWEKVRSRSKERSGVFPVEHAFGTVGAVALDRHGNLAAATSTGGLTNKRWGRVGDSPIAGAGTYADNGYAAISCTGTGEEFIRHGAARTVVARMQFAGESVREAAHAVIHNTLKKGDGGLIAVSRRGELVFSYSTQGMFRGRVRQGSKPEVYIWEEAESE